MKKIIAAISAITLTAACFASCSSDSKDSKSESATEATTVAETTTEESTEEDTTEAEEEEMDDEENYDTGDASLDNVRNQDDIGDNELLVVSFGTSFNDSRRLTIGAIEDALEKAFPDYSVRRGFTANIIIDHVNRRDGILIDDLDAALQRAVDNEVKNLVVQPTHLMNGLEYDELSEKVAEYSDAFDKVVIGEPLLTTDEDFSRVEKAITDWTKEYDDGETAICFMGHGTEAESNGIYAKMQELDDVIAKVKEGNYKRVILEPLMVVAGDHANNDMAGDEEDSWKSAFLAEGYDVECVLRGLGENEDIRSIYVDHAQAAIDSIK